MVFARETRRIPRLYGADLCGGALACLAVVPLLNWIGGPNTILAAARRDGRRRHDLGRVLDRAQKWQACLARCCSSSDRARTIPDRLIDVVYAKGMFRDPAWVEFARWNALSRVEVDRQGQAKAIVIDADASTYIMNATWRTGTTRSGNTI